MQKFFIFYKGLVSRLQMQRFSPKVKDVSLFKEIASNVVNPLETVREALSNSHDAEAKQITIITSRNLECEFILQIQDDGKGMDFDGLQRFFDLGNSKKDLIGIGRKGLGTKIYFKSKKIIVHTQTKDGEAFKATMDNPWEQINKGIIPQYTIEKIDPQPGKCGTDITIEGYNIDNPEKYFNFENLKDYILWFTAGGSFKTYFANCTELHKYIHNMQIAPRIFLDDRIFNKKEEISGTHPFSLPQEKPTEDPFEPIYKKSSHYSRHFGPYHRATNINGEYVSFQLFGTVSGESCRKEICKLRQGESIKSRFGAYLARDFILITKRSDLIDDSNFYHFHLLVNSQAFELTADRNSISNEDDPKVKWVLEEAKKLIDCVIKPLADEGYFSLRREEEAEYALRNKQIILKKRLERFEQLDNLVQSQLPVSKIPDCEAQVVILFTSILSNEKTKNYIKYIDKIGHYSQQSTTDMICIDKNNTKVLVEFEYKLSNLFKHEHPYETFDYVICWNIDMEINEKKKLNDGNTLNLIRENGEWMLKYGTQKVIPIIELRAIINKIENDNSIGTIEADS